MREYGAENEILYPRFLDARLNFSMSSLQAEREMVKGEWKMRNVCTVEPGSEGPALSPCESQAWSTRFPDPKSAFLAYPSP